MTEYPFTVTSELLDEIESGISFSRAEVRGGPAGNLEYTGGDYLVFGIALVYLLAR